MTDPIQRLREAHEAATPGPWAVNACKGTDGGDDCWQDSPHQDIYDGAPGNSVADISGDHPEAIADAHAIVLAHNALPALLDIAEAARTFIGNWDSEYAGQRGDALRAALDRLEEVGS
jgi:hypothetical protein